jgi:glutamate/tyrosine decarboxylase-like PLP-dependent enzyme
MKYGVGEIDKYSEKAEIMGRLGKFCISTAKINKLNQKLYILPEKIVCYCSEQAHSSVEKAALIAITRIRLLPTDENLSLRGETLRKAIEQDKKDGLIPFYVCATLGTYFGFI